MEFFGLITGECLALAAGLNAFGRCTRLDWAVLTVWRQFVTLTAQTLDICRIGLRFGHHIEPTGFAVDAAVTAHLRLFGDLVLLLGYTGRATQGHHTTRTTQHFSTIQFV